MTEDRPVHSWDGKMKPAGEIPEPEKGYGGYRLFKLVGATDEEKIDFERDRNIVFQPLARFYVPSIKEPYYTWEGKVVERSSLKGRELPLVE